jgi:hypothetical protein
MKMGQAQCSKILAFKLQMPLNRPQESKHSQQGESFKSSKIIPSVHPTKQIP